MKSKTSVLALLALLGVASAAGVAEAQTPPAGPATAAPSQMPPEVAREGQRIYVLQQQLLSRRFELNAQLATPNPDENRIRALTREITNLHGQILDGEVAMRRRMPQAGATASGGGICGACPMGGGMGMMGPHHGMGMGMGRGMMGGAWGGGPWGGCE